MSAGSPLPALGAAGWALAGLGLGAALLLVALARWRGEAGRRVGRALLGRAGEVLPGRPRARLAQAVQGWRRCYRYDYRREWLRFIDTLAAGEADRESLPERVVRAVAGVVGAGGGAVWSLEAGGQLRLLAARNLPPPEATGKAPGLIDALVARDGPVEVAYAAQLLGVELPAWLPRPPQAWLLLALVHRGRPTGLMVLAEPRARRELSWEERDLLRTLACEAASYLAEDEAARTLAETRELAAFNRRFAFVMHDIKNIAAQLTLTLGNARRHRHNPEFVDDMVATLESSVERMQLLMAQLRAGTSTAAAFQDTDLAEVLAELASGKGRRPRLAAPLPRIRVRTDRPRLVTVLQHLIDNGFEAAGMQGGVTLGLRREDGMAVIEVSDDGPGMSPEFVRQRLFRPFASTKPNGLGIGAFEAKTVVEELGGRLEADSRPGYGTTMRVYLPTERRPA